MNGLIFRRYFDCLVTLLLSVFISCERLGSGTGDKDGRLCVSLDISGMEQTRSSLDIPDTCDFILSVKDDKGLSVYNGALGDCPESLVVQPGSYLISIVSEVFSKPAFDAPQFGDEQCVVVPSGGTVGVCLSCVQLNAGIRLDISSDFLSACPDGVLSLKSSTGKLMYSYNERRYAYFHPGPVSLVMSSGGNDEVLMTRDMKAREMLSLKVSVAAQSVEKTNGISMSVDTSRVWSEGEYVIGNGADYDETDILTVAQAISLGECEDVWVSGYIVGGDLTSASASMELPFESRTSLLLGPRSTTTDRKSCLSVQLPSGEVRDALNLVDNPGVFRKRVKIKGDVVNAYYGLVGIKNTSEYFLFN